jgi:hypothetical protein
MGERRALVIASPGSISLQDAPKLVPGPGLSGTVILDVSAP